jgi:uncharacterized membrane protein
MSRRKNTIATLAVLLLVIGGNLFRISSNIHIRTVDFLSIFAIGVIAGLMISQIIALVRDKEKE